MHYSALRNKLSTIVYNSVSPVEFRYIALILCLSLLGISVNAQQAVKVVWPLHIDAEAVYSSGIASATFNYGSGLQSFKYDSINGATAGGWDSRSLDKTDYFEYKVIPEPDETITFNTLDFEVSLSTVNMRIAVHYSLDEFQTQSIPIGHGVFVGKNSSRDLHVETDITVKYPQILSIRIYGWSAPATVNFFTRNVEFNGSTRGPSFIPTSFNVGGGGSYCSGGTGVTITLDGSQIGVNYELLLGGTPTGIFLPGTGFPLNFNNVMSGGIYTIQGTDINTLESALMLGSAAVTIKPVPTATATPSTQTLCSGNSTGISLTSNYNPASFTWTVAQVDVMGGSNGSGSSIAQNLTATTVNPGSATYTITPTFNGCSGSPINAIVTVNPEPIVIITPGNQTLCSGESTNLALSSNLPGSSFTWTALPTLVSGASNGAGNSIVQTLTTTTSGQGTVLYTVTPVSTAGCIGNNGSASVIVKPVPAVSAIPLSQTACPGQNITPINITNPNNVTGTSFSWTRDNVAGLTGLESGTGPQISGIINSSNPAALLTTTYTITATANGCSSSITASVTIGDSQPPVLTCPVTGVQNVTTDPDCKYIHAGASWDAEATDNCNFSLTYQLTGSSSGTGTTLDGVAFELGITTVTWTATDLAGNIQTCSFTVNVVDDDDPLINCPVSGTQNVTTSFGFCTYNHSGTGWNATASDNCDPSVSITYSLSGATSGTGSSLNGVAFNQGSTTVTWTATDDGGNSSVCTFIVVVTDNQSPTISCPGNQIRAANTGICSYTVVGNEFDPLSFNDNCPGSTIRNTFNNLSTLAGAVLPQGVTNISWIVTAANLQTASCGFTVTVNDGQAPTINCPNNITEYTGPGSTTCGKNVTWTPPVPTDNCLGPVTLTCSHVNGSFFPVGTTTVTYTAIDGSLNSIQCNFTITVVDNTPPSFNILNSITVNTAANCIANISPAVTGNPTSVIDNCGVSIPAGITYSDGTPVPGACAGNYSFTRTWVVTDVNGNSSTKPQTIIVQDKTAPLLIVPPNKLVDCADPVTIYGTATATDNCDANPVVTFTEVIVNDPTCPSGKIITRTWRATDCSGNVSTGIQIITVDDNIAPIIDNTGNMTVNCPSQIPDPNPGSITAHDNCGPVTITFDYDDAQFPPAAPGYCPDYINRYFNVVDQCGNRTVAIQYIDVLNPLAPACHCSECLTSNSFYAIDFRTIPSGTITILNPERKDKCCDADKQELCISFSIYIPAGGVGLQILVDGGHPNGSGGGNNFWKVDCEEVEFLNNDFVCLAGDNYYLFTYCKSGQNSNNSFTFTLLEGLVQAPDITARVSCNSQIIVNTTASGVVWNSISPGTPGQYNNYLSCLDCSNPIFNPDANAPDIIQYQVCGTMANMPCFTNGFACDTVTIYVLDSISVTFNVDPGAYCNDAIPEITATVNPTGSTYVLNWYKLPDMTTSLGSAYTFQPTSAGDYCLKVHDTDNGVPCPDYYYYFTVAPDNDPPTVTPPPPLILECEDPTNTNKINDWLALAYAEDDHDPALYVINDFNGITQDCNSTITVTFSATDDCNNTGNATSTITIHDIGLPYWTSTAGDLNRTVECSDAASLASAQTLLPQVTDLCDELVTITKISGSLVSGACPQSGTITNTFTAIDDCGNETSDPFVQVITITDATAPAWTTLAGDLNRSVSCNDAAGLASAQTLLPAATDICDPDVIITKTSGAQVPAVCPVIYTITNTFVATDHCGNISGIYTQVITVNDIVPPVVTLQPSDLTVECDGTGNLTDLNNWLNTQGGATATDLCTIVTWTNNYTGLSNLCGATGSATVIFTASDVCGNNAVTNAATFTILDTQDPTLTCPPDVVAQADPVNCDVDDVDLGTPVTNDACSNVVVTNNAPASFPPGVTIVIWTATDDCGNSITCNQTVTVQDLLPPSVECPVSPVTVNAEPGKCEAFVNVPLPNVTDPCPYTITPASLSGIYPVGTTTVTYTITGVSGVSAICPVDIVVVDNQPPTIACPGDQLFTAPAPACTLLVTTIPDPIITDNCAIASLTLSWEKIFNGVTIETGTGNINNTVFNVGVTTVIYTVTDLAGNYDDCTFTVTVNDLVPPTVITCPGNITVNADPGLCNANVTVPLPVVTDPCQEIVSMVNNFNGTNNASGQYPVGTTTVLWTFTDVSGNTSTCQHTVTVIDNQPATLLCPPNVIDEITNGGCTLVVDNIEYPQITDNCPYTLIWQMTGATTGNSPATGVNYVNGQTFNVGVTSVKYILTDISGAQIECTFQVWVKNLTAPEFDVTCPQQFITVNASANCSTYVALEPPVITNPCTELYTISNTSPYKTSNDDASGTYPPGSTSFTWTIIDASGNIFTCDQTVTVTDVTPPTLSCPDNVIDFITNGGCTLVSGTIGNPSYTDNCGVTALTYVLTGATTGISPNTGINLVNTLAFNVGITTVTYTAWDAAGNNISCFFTVWIRNLSAPQFTVTCPQPNVSVDASADCETFVTVPAPGIVNPCTELYTISNTSTYKTSDADASGTYPVGTTSFTWTITDASGNVTTCPQSVTVTDNTDPVIDCPDNIEQEIINGGCELENVIIPDPTFSDNCDLLSLSWIMTGATTNASPLTGFNYVSGETFRVGVTTVIYLLTDINGNEATCSFTVWIKNKVNPPFEVTCPADVTVSAPADRCDADVTVIAPAILNPCGELYTMIPAGNISGTFNVGTTTISWTVTDASGNITICDVDITVEDNTPPTLDCPGPIVRDADFEQPYASNVPVPAPTYWDACGVETLTYVAAGATPSVSGATGINIYPSPGTFNVGVTTITYTAIDFNGNPATCSFTVTVISEPEITCPINISTTTDPGVCSATLNPGSPTLVSGVEPITWTYTITNQAGTQIATGTCSTATLATCIGNYAFPTGVNTIHWTASNISGVDDCYQTVTVVDDEAPVFTVPLNPSFCVIDIFSAVYDGQPEPQADIVPDPLFAPPYPTNWVRPDWYILNGTELDLTGVTDNCCIDDTGISWIISFTGNDPNQPDITGIGHQPSAHGPIILWGTPANVEITHTITYTVTDCNGNVSGPTTINIIVKPRPDVIKQ